MHSRSQRAALVVATLTSAVVLLVIAAAGAHVGAATQGEKRHFTIVGSNYAFRPGSITVDRNDLVTITFSAEDIPHSFTVDGYRISKRAGAGQTVTFEFLADRPGKFEYYCSLTQDPKCKSMRGMLVVK